MHRGVETQLHHQPRYRMLRSPGPSLKLGTSTSTSTSSRLVILGLLALAPAISRANILYDPPKNNPLNIDWYPAPSPEDGPPASANATRDKSLLPAQIGAILGAYVFCLCVIGISLILIARKLRLRIRGTVNKTIDIEMVQPSPIKTATFNPYPLTPNSQRNFSWPSPENDSKNPYVFPNSAVSPITPTDETQVDTRIVQADREMLQRDLEDIYAHVMEQEEAKAAGVNVKEMPSPQLLKTGPVPVPVPSPQRSTASGKKDRRPSTLNFDETKKSRASSIISSIMSPRKKNSRVMQISSPLATPNSASFPYSANSDEEPLTPRYYHQLPPPPPVPGMGSHDRKSSFPHSIDEDRESTFTRDEDRKSSFPPTRQNSNNGPSPTLSIDAQLSTLNLKPQHKPTTSDTSTVPMSAASATSTTKFFPTLPSSPRASKAPHPQLQPLASNRPNPSTLPFRQFETALASPSFAPSTKTTVLERTVPQHSGPLTAGLKTPWSAGAVPYSPYQPFSPLMPMTPRLVTKQDRKAMKKAEPRGPVTEMVPDASETWY